MRFSLDIVVVMSLRTVIVIVVSSRTDPDDDVVDVDEADDVTSSSALDVAEIEGRCHRRCRRRRLSRRLTLNDYGIVVIIMGIDEVLRKRHRKRPQWVPQTQATRRPVCKTSSTT